MPSAPDRLQLPLWRAITIYRFASLAYAAFMVVRNLDRYAHPLAAVPVLAVMAAWSVAAAYLYARPERRGWPLLGADLAVVVAVLLVTPEIVGRTALAAGVATIAVAWLGSPVLAWAVAGGRRRGTVAALVVAGLDLAVRDRISQSTLTGAMLLILAGLVLGHVASLAATVDERWQRAIELEAATRERERLARDIHDSVLQVLALVQRRGAHLDGEAGELARMAGEQEAALRSLITRAGHTAPPGDDCDLRPLIGAYAGADVTVAEPATAVRLPGAAARELAAAVGAALDNVARHGGGRAWVLIEEEPTAVTVSVRDCGPGIAPGRLAEAERQGRLGFAQSMRGRMARLGGDVRLHSTPGEGTEVEFVLPRRER